MLVLVRLENLARDLVGQRGFLFRVEDADVARFSSVVELRLLRSTEETNGGRFESSVRENVLVRSTHNISRTELLTHFFDGLWVTPRNVTSFSFLSFSLPSPYTELTAMIAAVIRSLSAGSDTEFLDFFEAPSPSGKDLPTPTLGEDFRTRFGAAPLGTGDAAFPLVEDLDLDLDLLFFDDTTGDGASIELPEVDAGGG